MIRNLSERDLPKLLDIHRNFYEKEFIFPELNDPKWLGKYVVTDDYDNVILFGGVRLLAESVAMTDKRYSVRERKAALIKLLQASLFVSSHLNFDQLHAFIQDETWSKHLKKYGFKPCKGAPLVINLGEGE
jgi:hypothetical protein